MTVARFARFGALFAALTIFVIESATAGLMLSVTDAGGGNTRWVFSGSTTASHSDSVNSFWGRNWSPGNPTNTSSFNSSILSGSGTLTTTSGGTKAVTDVWTQDVFTTQIGPRVGSDLSWASGDTLSWSGDLIAAVDISTLNIGTYTTKELYNGFVSDDLVVKIGSSFGAVPEPASLIMWGFAGGLGLIIARRRRRATIA